MKKSLLVVASLSFAAPVAAQESERAQESAKESDRAPDTPRVAPADSLRAPGRVVLDDVVGGGIGPLSITVGWITVQSSSQEALGARTTSTLLAFQPSADVFVFEGLSVGGALGVSRATQKSEPTDSPPSGAITGQGASTTTARSIAPRVGYAFRLSDDLLFWPRVRFGYGTSETTNGVTFVGTGTGVLGAPAPNTSSSGEMWTVGGDASLVFALGRHAAIAAGPYVAYAFQKQDEPHQTASSFDISVRGSLRLAF